MTTTATRAIYPARRALENAVSDPDVRPTRLFPVLWPLWQVEVTGDLGEEYDVIDRHLVRAIRHAGLSRISELALFYGLPESLVRRCLHVLALIGHVQPVGAGAILTDAVQVRLTPLGVHSVDTDLRFAPKEDRQKLLFDRFTGAPLPRLYYGPSVRVLSTPEAPSEVLSDRSVFTPFFSVNQFQADVVHRLARRPDRDQYNLPVQLANVHVLANAEAYLPVYLIEVADGGAMAYTAADEDPDPLFGRLCAEVPEVSDRLATLPAQNAAETWARWVRDSPGPGAAKQRPDGTWRLTLAPDAFGDRPKLPVSRIGSFELRKHLFAQIWCADRALRRRALLTRARGMTRSGTDPTVVSENVKRLAKLLEVEPPTPPEIDDSAELRGT